MTVEVNVEERDGQFWVELSGQPQRLTGNPKGPFDNREDAEDAAEVERYAQNDSGLGDKED